MIHLNQRAWSLCQQLPTLADQLRVRRLEGVGWDFGNGCPGGLAAGLFLARVCLSDLATVRFQPSALPGTGWAVQVETDHPKAACIHSQYAGWKVADGDFFAMGSGPMRRAAAIEAVFEGLPKIDADVAVGVLETDRVPTAKIVQSLADQCGVAPDHLCLLVARTASQAGNVQVVARSVETCLHKLAEIGADLDKIESAAGIAPLPPVAKDDLLGIGWTNDAILYGASVTLWVRGDDAYWEPIVSQIPSSASRDYGRPFAETFKSYEYDFYKIDHHLFSPASVTLINLDTGTTHRAGQINQDLLRQSFATP